MTATQPRRIRYVLAFSSEARQAAKIAVIVNTRDSPDIRSERLSTLCFKRVKSQPSFFAPFRPLFCPLWQCRRRIPSEACSDSIANACGHRWIPETENSPNCPSKACRSMLWNKGGVDGRTRESRIKAGRSCSTAVRKAQWCVITNSLE